MKKDMRVVLTKRLLREGFMRCLEREPIDKITISELCEESGVNRTTFYNHYQVPVQILNDMAREYSEHLKVIYQTHFIKDKKISEELVEECCEYLYKNRKDIRILLTENADRHLKRMAMEIMEQIIRERKAVEKMEREEAEIFRYYVRASGAAAYEIICCWLKEEDAKSPMEMMALTEKLFYTFLPDLR